METYETPTMLTIKIDEKEAKSIKDICAFFVNTASESTCGDIRDATKLADDILNAINITF